MEPIRECLGGALSSETLEGSVGGDAENCDTNNREAASQGDSNFLQNIFQSRRQTVFDDPDVTLIEGLYENYRQHSRDPANKQGWGSPLDHAFGSKFEFTTPAGRPAWLEVYANGDFQIEFGPKPVKGGQMGLLSTMVPLIKGNLYATNPPGANLAQQALGLVILSAAQGKAPTKKELDEKREVAKEMGTTSKSKSDKTYGLLEEAVKTGEAIAKEVDEEAKGKGGGAGSTGTTTGGGLDKKDEKKEDKKSYCMDGASGACSTAGGVYDNLVLKIQDHPLTKDQRRSLDEIDTRGPVSQPTEGIGSRHLGMIVVPTPAEGALGSRPLGDCTHDVDNCAGGGGLTLDRCGRLTRSSGSSWGRSVQEILMDSENRPGGRAPVCYGENCGSEPRAPANPLLKPLPGPGEKPPPPKPYR